MELLKHLVVSENGDSESSGSSGNDATRSDDLIKEDNSSSEDTGGVGRNLDTMSREAMTEGNDVGDRNDVSPESDKCNGLENVGGKKTKKNLKYKAMEDADPSEQRLKINLNNSLETVSSNGLNDSKTKRKKKRVKSKPPQCKTESYIDPLELKYLELNDILVRDYIERKRPVRYETPCRQKDSVGGLYEQYVAIHGRPPPVPGLAKAITRPYNQTTPSKITISVKRHSHQSENESDEPISDKLSCNSNNNQKDVKFHRPVSANVVRPSRSRRKDTGTEKQSPLRRSRSAGSGRLNRRKTRSTNSLQNDLISGGRTDTDSSTISSPGRQEPTDCHLKDTRNESIREWLERKNKLLKQEMKLRRQKKRQERLEQMDKAVALYERSVLSEKETQKWMLRKRREVWLKNKEDELMKDLQNKAAQEDKEITTTQLKSSIKSPRDNPKARSVSFQDERLGDEIERRASKNKETEPGSETPLLYKRAVRGKIRFQMPKINKKRTTRPSPVEREQNKAEKKKEMRVSYDQWLFKKRNEDLEKRRAQESKTPENELRQSDPTCEILRQEGRRRVLKGKQQLDTGIVHDNEEQGETNNSGYRPKSAKFRERPKPSSKSPVRINRRLENAMANDKKSNPFVLPFPPEHGVPRHVAAKQREIFADKVWKAAEEHPPVSDHEDDGAADGDVERQSRKDEGETDSSSSTVTTAEDVGEQSPRYGFNRSKSPVSSSSNENSAPNRTRLSDDGITVDSTENSEHVPDSIFLTSLELP